MDPDTRQKAIAEYHLIEEKDWRTLTDILDDFKRCEEQLQKEWGNIW